MTWLSNFLNNKIHTTESNRFNKESFFKFILTGHKPLLIVSAVVAIGYLITLRLLFPVPSFYADSFTWIGGAKTNQPVTFRPIGYSKFIQFFRIFSSTDIALIAGQYLSNLLANLFLFFSCCYFFSLQKWYRYILFALLIFNPFYLLYSNYVSSDAFFCSLTVLWFTLLIWMLYKPTWKYILLQLILLAILFELRYNAVIYPFITSVAIVLIRTSWQKKAGCILAMCVMIASLIIITEKATEAFAGTKTFSAFSGWQMANNAMLVLQHTKTDTTLVEDREVRDVVKYVQPFFDTAKFIPAGVNAWYMWHDYSPLKKYMAVYAPKGIYFITWNALGPIYNKFGKHIILQNPSTYLRYFVMPNAKSYFVPPLEAYETYMEGKDTIAQVAVKYFNYKSNRTPRQHPTIYRIVFNSAKYMFTIANIAFIIFCIGYYSSKKYKSQLPLFNNTLLCFVGLYIANVFFVVLLAPTVFRYHIHILTVAFAIIMCLLQTLVTNKNNEKKILNQ